MVYLVLYGFADASGSGFGSTVLSDKGITFGMGTWEKDAESNSSNWKEFENIVESLEEDGGGRFIDWGVNFFGYRQFHGGGLSV